MRHLSDEVCQLDQKSGADNGLGGQLSGTSADRLTRSQRARPGSEVGALSEGARDLGQPQRSWKTSAAWLSTDGGNAPMARFALAGLLDDLRRRCHARC